LLNGIEKAVMLLLYEKCVNKESVLISPTQLIISLLPKYEVTEKELDKIMNNLILDGYIDVINSDNKGNPIYCVSLKMKGISFQRDLINHKKNNQYTILKTIVLAAISTMVAIILRIIFS
jgi:hypothetical protein